MTPDIRHEIPPSEELLDRYFFGEAESASMVEAWGGETPDGTPRARMVREIVIADGEAVQHATVVQQRIHDRLNRMQERPRPSLRYPRRQWIAVTSAATVLVAVAAIGFGVLRPKSHPVEVMVVTHPGERSRFQLPDGSTVLLGPGSTLKYPRKFQAQRAITLDGEALFTVTQSDGTPFTVRAGAASTRVLGTSFTVRRYTTDRAAHIVVAEGKVAVVRSDAGGTDNPTVLTTGEQAIVPDSSGLAHSRVVDIGAALGWTQGKLVYQRTPLQQVIADMQRMYDVTIVLSSPSLGGQRFTGVIDQTAVADALAMLAATFNFTVRHQGRTFTLGE